MCMSNCKLCSYYRQKQMYNREGVQCVNMSTYMMDGIFGDDENHGKLFFDDGHGSMGYFPGQQRLTMNPGQLLDFQSSLHTGGVGVASSQDQD